MSVTTLYEKLQQKYLYNYNCVFRVEIGGVIFG